MLGVRLSVPKGAYAVTVGAGGGKTINVAAADLKGLIGKLSKGFKAGAERVVKPGTKGYAYGLYTVGKNGKVGKKGNGGKIWAVHGAIKTKIKAKQTNPRMISTEIFVFKIFIVIHLYIFYKVFVLNYIIFLKP